MPRSLCDPPSKTVSTENVATAPVPHREQVLNPCGSKEFQEGDVLQIQHRQFVTG